MKLKTKELEDGTVVAEVKDGKPVFVDDKGEEHAIDVPHSLNKISQLNGEAQKHREAKEAAEDKLKAFEGIDDAEAARKAIQTVAALDDKELVEAGKVEEIKAAAVKATEEKMEAALAAKDEEIATLTADKDKLSGTLNDELIGGAFARSKFVEENIAVPVDFVQAKFGSNFKVEDGKRVGYGPDGKPIYSKSKPGEIADFDEALEILVNNYEHKDSILKGRNKNGSGSEPPGGRPNGKTISRADFDALPEHQRRQAISDNVRIVDAV